MFCNRNSVGVLVQVPLARGKLMPDMASISELLPALCLPQNTIVGKLKRVETPAARTLLTTEMKSFEYEPSSSGMVVLGGERVLAAVGRRAVLGAVGATTKHNGSEHDCMMNMLKFGTCAFCE